MTVNVNLMLENLSQIKSGITINVDIMQESGKTSCMPERLSLES